MRKLLLTSALLLTPITVSAETQAERFENLTSDMTRVMWGMMANEAEKEGGDGAPIRAAIGKFEWTDALDTATGCILDRYNAKIGSAAVDDLFDRMDTMISRMEGLTITEFTDQIDASELLPEGLTEDDSLEINQECGMIEAQSAMMAETGFTAAFMAAMAAAQ